MNRRKLLLVEDEPGLVMTIHDRLVAAGYAVDTAIDGNSALRRFPGKGGESPYDLVILDVMLPDIDGFEVCQKLRARGFAVAILMLTARNAVEDRVKGLKIGADDYLPKPFSMAELLARVEALLRRGTAVTAPQQESNGPVTFGAFILDLKARTLTQTGEHGTHEIALSPTEYRLLSHLATHPGTVMTREDLLDVAWGYNNEVVSRTVDVHVAWLRQKLGEPNPPRHLLTVRGGGYKFVP